MTQLALPSPVQCYMSLFHPVTLQSDQAVHSLTSQSTENPKMAVHCENFQSGLIQSIAYTRQRASSATWEENILSPHLRTRSEKFGLLRNEIMWSWSIPKFWQEGNPPSPHSLSKTKQATQGTRAGNMGKQVPYAKWQVPPGMWLLCQTKLKDSWDPALISSQTIQRNIICILPLGSEIIFFYSYYIQIIPRYCLSNLRKINIDKNWRRWNWNALWMKFCHVRQQTIVAPQCELSQDCPTDQRALSSDRQLAELSHKAHCAHPSSSSSSFSLCSPLLLFRRPLCPTSTMNSTAHHMIW